MPVSRQTASCGNVHLHQSVMSSIHLQGGLPHGRLAWTIPRHHWDKQIRWSLRAVRLMRKMDKNLCETSFVWSNVDWMRFIVDLRLARVYIPLAKSHRISTSPAPVRTFTSVTQVRSRISFTYGPYLLCVHRRQLHAGNRPHSQKRAWDAPPQSFDPHEFSFFAAAERARLCVSSSGSISMQLK